MVLRDGGETKGPYCIYTRDPIPPPQFLNIHFRPDKYVHKVKTNMSRRCYGV
jgi:hypothetical protein